MVSNRGDSYSSLVNSSFILLDVHVVSTVAGAVNAGMYVNPNQLRDDSYKHAFYGSLTVG